MIRDFNSLHVGYGAGRGFLREEMYAIGICTPFYRLLVSNKGFFEP